MNSVFGPSFDAQWRERFERFAQHHSSEAYVSGWSDSGLTRRLGIFTEILEHAEVPFASVTLDLGCGAGTYSRLLAGRGHWVVGLDYSAPSLVRALQYDPGGICTYAAGDGYALPFAAATFDLVVCIGVLQAVATPERVLDEVSRVLRSPGLLVVEALNARAIAARVGRAHKAARRLPERVRTYDPSRVEQWLAARHLRLVMRAAIVLPPRQLPGLGRVLDVIPMARRFTGIAPVANAVAHSFLFVARKPPVSDPSTHRTPLLEI